MMRQRQLPPSFLKRRNEEKDINQDDELGLSKFRKMELTEEVVDSESEPEFDIDDLIYELEREENEEPSEVDSEDIGISEDSERETEVIQPLSEEFVFDSEPDEEEGPVEAPSPIEEKILGSPMAIEPSEEATEFLIDQKLQGTPMEYSYLIDELETLPPTPKLDKKLLKDLFGEDSEEEAEEEEAEEEEAEDEEAEEPEILELHDVGIMTSPVLDDESLDYRVIMDYINTEDEKLIKQNEKFIQTQQMGGDKRRLQQYKDDFPDFIEVKADDLTHDYASYILNSKFGNDYPSFLLRYLDIITFKDQTKLISYGAFIDEELTENSTVNLRAMNLSNLLKTTTIEWTSEYILKIFTNIVNAVNFLHKNGIVHNNLNPDNILCKLNGDIQIINFTRMCTKDTIPFQKEKLTKFDSQMTLTKSDSQEELEKTEKPQEIIVNCTNERTPTYIDNSVFQNFLIEKEGKVYAKYEPYSDIAGLNVIFFELVSKIKPVMLSDIEEAKNKLEEVLQIKVDKRFEKTEATIIDNWTFKIKRNDYDIPYDINAEVKEKLVSTYIKYLKKKDTIKFKQLIMTFLFLRMYHHPKRTLEIINEME